MISIARTGATAAAVALVASVSACARDDGGTCASNAAMMAALTPTCGGCHTGGPSPFFSSQRAFDSLLAFNREYVIPGDPDGSYLVDLLEGNGTGAYPQMPLSGDAFAELAADGKTIVSLEEVKAWIAEMPPDAKVTTPDPSIVAVSRLSVLQLRDTLYAQLGLSNADFFRDEPGYNGSVAVLVSRGEYNYPVHGPTELPGLHASTTHPFARYRSLEGSTVTPPFAQALIHTSQRWCKLGIAKSENKALLFPHVEKEATSAEAADAIKTNLAYWYLHFLGEHADPAEVEDVFANLFVTLESESGPVTAWAGVCSYLIRHPKWIAF